MSSVAAITPSSRPDGQPPRAPAQAQAAQPRLEPDRVSLSGEAKARLGGGRLTPEQQQVVAQLRQRDAEVRAHEAAHQSAGGQLTGAASFSYQTGPDGKSYAVGGEVPISAHAGRTPEETIAVARQVRAAALAPADPSSADLQAASSATQMEAQAQQQLRAQQASGADGAGNAARGQGAPASASTQGEARRQAAAGVPAAAASASPAEARPASARQASVASGLTFSLEQLVVRPRA